MKKLIQKWLLLGFVLGWWWHGSPIENYVDASTISAETRQAENAKRKRCGFNDIYSREVIVFPTYLLGCGFGYFLDIRDVK